MTAIELYLTETVPFVRHLCGMAAIFLIAFTAADVAVYKYNPSRKKWALMVILVLVAVFGPSKELIHLMLGA